MLCAGSYYYVCLSMFQSSQVLKIFNPSKLIPHHMTRTQRKFLPCRFSEFYYWLQISSIQSDNHNQANALHIQRRDTTFNHSVGRYNQLQPTTHPGELLSCLSDSLKGSCLKYFGCTETFACSVQIAGLLGSCQDVYGRQRMGSCRV